MTEPRDEEIRVKALEIYDETQCGTGCCGNIDGAVNYILMQIDDIEAAAYTRGVDAERMNQYDMGL